MRNTMALVGLALAALGSAGCWGYVSTRYSGGYYYGTAPARVVYQQPATQVVYQQPAVVYTQPVYEEPVVLTTPPAVYYYQPTGYYRRPAIYGGVRIYVAP